LISVGTRITGPESIGPPLSLVYKCCNALALFHLDDTFHRSSPTPTTNLAEAIVVKRVTPVDLFYVAIRSIRASSRRMTPALAPNLESFTLLAHLFSSKYAWMYVCKW
jgi:hypothetical protein